MKNKPIIDVLLQQSDISILVKLSAVCTTTRAPALQTLFIQKDTAALRKQRQLLICWANDPSSWLQTQTQSSINTRTSIPDLLQKYLSRFKDYASRNQQINLCFAHVCMAIYLYHCQATTEEVLSHIKRAQTYTYNDPLFWRIIHFHFARGIGFLQENDLQVYCQLTNDPQELKNYKADGVEVLFSHPSMLQWIEKNPATLRDTYGSFSWLTCITIASYNKKKAIELRDKHVPDRKKHLCTSHSEVNNLVYYKKLQSQLNSFDAADKSFTFYDTIAGVNSKIRDIIISLETLHHRGVTVAAPELNDFFTDLFSSDIKLSIIFNSLRNFTQISTYKEIMSNCAEKIGLAPEFRGIFYNRNIQLSYYLTEKSDHEIIHLLLTNLQTLTDNPLEQLQQLIALYPALQTRSHSFFKLLYIEVFLPIHKNATQFTTNQQVELAESYYWTNQSSIYVALRYCPVGICTQMLRQCHFTPGDRKNDFIFETIISDQSLTKKIQVALLTLLIPSTNNSIIDFSGASDEKIRICTYHIIKKFIQSYGICDLTRPILVKILESVEDQVTTQDFFDWRLHQLLPNSEVTCLTNLKQLFTIGNEIENEPKFIKEAIYPFISFMPDDLIDHLSAKAAHDHQQEEFIQALFTHVALQCEPAPSQQLS